jgi:hypothetical protein
MTTAIVGSGVGCGMYVGGASPALTLERVQPAVVAAANSTATPTPRIRGLGLPANRSAPPATHPSRTALGILADVSSGSSIQKIDETHQRTSARFTPERAKRGRTSQIDVKL